MSKYFKLYENYMGILEKLNPFQFKKVITAIMIYICDGQEPLNLSKKGLTVFNLIKTVIIAEKEKSLDTKRKAGKKGAEKRWNNDL